jgi:hypothetical protein
VTATILRPYGREESQAQYERLARELLTKRAAADRGARVKVSNDVTVAELGDSLTSSPAAGRDRNRPRPSRR